MSEWRPIETAPKDGTVVRIGWKEDYHTDIQEWFTMQWGHIQQNGLFPEHIGMWVSPDGSFTWNGTIESGGPTHWRETE